MDTLKTIPFSIALFLIGAIFFLLGLTGGITIGSYSLVFQEILTRIVSSVFGVILVGYAISTEAKSKTIGKIKDASIEKDQTNQIPLSIPENKNNPLDKRNGIIEIYNMQDRDEQTKRNKETKELILQGSIFYLLALSAVSYIDPGIKRHWDYLKPKLDNGATIKILLMDPFQKEKKYRDKLNSISTSLDPKFRFDLLVNLYNRYSNANIRIAAQNIYCSVFFSEKEMIYDPYHLGKIGDRLENNFFALRIANSENTINYYHILKQHFEYLWSTSEDFESFVKRQHSNLVIPYKKVEIKHRPHK